MKCQICQKNVATIHIQEFANGDKQIWHLCEDCAKKKGLAAAGIAPVQLQNMLQQFMDTMTGKADPGSAPPDLPEIQCPVCAWDTEKFKKTKRLGCPECYQAFETLLKDQFRLEQHGMFHRGYMPPVPKNTVQTEKAMERTGTRQELDRLRKGLDESIRREEYELAAELRDKIEILKKELAN